jgi:glyoxylase-like metal-dependent hydrolase (beta-lactamase superfamily II)/ferredoxin
MARAADRVPENASGPLFVDESCIDCDLCRQIEPRVFAASDVADRSYVRRQPATDAERLRSAMALVACPTSSIGGASKAEVDAAVRAFPEPITSDVSFCGFASEDSFGAASYLARRGAGNLLVDSPRAAKPLLARIEELGGVATMFLTHADDVADHEVFRRRFGCERVLHRADARGGTAAVERKLDGLDPVRLDHDLLAIPVPGHTRGSAALLYREDILFTGDHLWASEETGRLHASRGVCWYSWAEQTRSMERLLDHRFEWVLPGHGRRYRARSAREMRAELERLVAWMRAQA